MATSEDSERKGKAPVDDVDPVSEPPTEPVDVPTEPVDVPPVDSAYEDPPPSEQRESGVDIPPPAKPKAAAVVTSKDYIDPEPVPIWDPSEFQRWSLWRATIAEFMASFLFLNICVQAVVGNAADGSCNGIGTLGIAFTFGITIYVLVYCIAGISGGHINPAITFAMFLLRRVSFPRALLYIIAQVLGGLAGVGLVKAYQKGYYQRYGGGANFVQFGYSKGAGLVAEMIGTFVLVYVVLSATDAKRKARDAYVPPLAPAAIGLAVFIVHMATVPITGTSINPARSFATAAYWDHHDHAWHDQWIFWIGPLTGSTVAVLYQQYIMRAIPFNQLYLVATSRP